MLRTPIVEEYESRNDCQNFWAYFVKSAKFSTNKRVNSISVSHNALCRYAITCGRSINIYRASSDQKCRRVSGFSKTVMSCSFRYDGKMIVGGEEGGLFRICTTDKNTYQLRKIKAHEGDVIDVDFSADGHKTVSLGSDGFLKTWDVALGEMENKYRVAGSGEKPNGLAVGKVNENLLAIGNFDGAVKLFDSRQPTPINSFKLPTGVSSLHLMSKDLILVASSGQWLYSWDISAGKPYSPHQDVASDRFPGLYCHYKQITSVTSCFCPELTTSELIISVGMDKLIKITSLDSYEELHQAHAPAPITGVGVFPSLKSLVVGCENGLVRTFRLAMPETNATKSTKVQLPGDIPESFDSLDPSLTKIAAQFSGHWRSANASRYQKSDAWFNEPTIASRLGPKDWGYEGKKAPLIHPTTEVSRVYSGLTESVQLTRLDRFLSKFEHTRALSASLRYGQQAIKHGKGMTSVSSRHLSPYAYTIACVRELCRRGALMAAVGGRNDAQLSRLLSFVRKNVWHREATPTCILLFQVISTAYPQSHLVAVPEFLKVCEILRAMGENAKTTEKLSDFVRKVLYPSVEEIVPSHRSPMKPESSSAMEIDEKLSSPREQVTPIRSSRRISKTAKLSKA